MLDGVSALTIWRERAGFTQHALATRANVSPSYLNELETGTKQASVAALKALAAALEVPIDALLD